MGRFVKVLEVKIRCLAEELYPDELQEVFFQSIRFQKIQLPTKKLLQQFPLLSVRISDCDLRTLQNFPNLPTLQELCLSRNRLQGTFEHIMKLKQLKYLDASQNIVKETVKILPLRRIQGLICCFEGNPVEKSAGFTLFIQGQGLVLEKQPRPIKKPVSRPKDKEKTKPPPAKDRQNQPQQTNTTSLATKGNKIEQPKNGGKSDQQESPSQKEAGSDSESSRSDDPDIMLDGYNYSVYRRNERQSRRENLQQSVEDRQSSKYRHRQQQIVFFHTAYLGATQPRQQDNQDSSCRRSEEQDSLHDSQDQSKQQNSSDRSSTPQSQSQR